MDLALYLDRFAPDLRIRRAGRQRMIFDVVRSKWLVLQPEEFVRQLFLQYLLNDLAYPRHFITTERGLRVNERAKRCDILILDQKLQPWMLVECKSPDVPLTEATNWQAAIYNQELRVQFMVVTNGPTTRCCAMLDYEAHEWTYLDSLPAFAQTAATYR
jgi:hypothetical protein